MRTITAPARRRHASSDDRRVQYDLSPAGAALEPVVRAMEEWGRRHVRGG